MTTLAQIEDILDDGGVCVLPTETIYGIAGRAHDQDAIDRIYEIKGRVFTKPLAVCIGSIAAAEKFAEFNDIARQLADTFWPGPLSLVLPATDILLDPRCYGQHGTTISLRFPDIEWTDTLLKTPLALTSANRAGEPESATANTTINARVDAVLDSGPCENGAPSTILSVTGKGVKLLRQGALPISVLKQIDMNWL
ncbi:L-threonylcarbamoyladenylate synthase [Litorimonas sp. RW-G-Af-16]|uniref:L-threonylcarbamoyladenylate synthase n=1 Tax=Litorimonas sp. RW-G-Af-16 TaxID=3241168 RepID=UPI00390C6E40